MSKLTGAQVVVSYIMLTAWAMVLCVVVVGYDLKGKERPFLFKRLLASASDTQLLFGAGLAVFSLIKSEDMIPYHLFIALVSCQLTHDLLLTETQAGC